MTEHDERQIEMLLAENKTLNLTVKNLEESIDILVSLNKKLHQINGTENEKIYILKNILSNIIEKQLIETEKGVFEWVYDGGYSETKAYKYPENKNQSNLNRYEASFKIVTNILIDNLKDNRGV